MCINLHIAKDKLINGVTVTAYDEEPLYTVPTMESQPPRENEYVTLHVNPCVYYSVGKAKKFLSSQSQHQHL